MNNNYDPNPALLSMNDDNQDFETDYDMQDYFSSYNYWKFSIKHVICMLLSLFIFKWIR